MIKGDYYRKMDYNKIENKFCACLGSDNVYRNEPMRKHTTFRIGGPADFYLCPHSAKEIQKTVAICREEELPYFILGNGSNLLVSDQGYRGVVIQLWKNVSDILVEGCRIRAKAGASLAKIAGEALEEGLTGMEFAAGIPGTLGGAVVMNAGAYGGEMKDILQEALVMDEQGEIFTLKKEELHLGYRTSIIKEKGYIVLAAALELKPGDRKEIKEKMDELKQRRVEKQPLDMPSAGSTFKRPEGYFAGKLIMDAGLRGFSVGGAQISEKHCGFVVNTGKATANDVLTLIREVQKRVRDKFGVELETEVKFLGEF